MKRLLLLVVCLFGLTSVAHAQFLNGVAGQPAIKTTPAYPEPGQSVDASLDAYGFDTDGAIIQWFIDGVERTDVQNSRSLTFTAGRLGTVTTLTAQVALPNGQTITANKEITPARLDVIIEADTTTPLNYNGRALPSSGSTVRAIALPQLGTNASNLSFKWTLDNKVLEGGTLVGNDVVTFNAPFSGRPVLGVEVMDGQGDTVAKKNVLVPIQEPEMYFYESNPLRGLAHYAVTDTYQFIGDEVAVRAEPYYMASDIFSTNPHMEWEVNGRTLQNPSEDPQMITLRNNGGTGTFRVSFHLRNLQELLQGIEEEFTVRF